MSNERETPGPNGHRASVDRSGYGVLRCAICEKPCPEESNLPSRLRTSRLWPDVPPGSVLCDTCVLNRYPTETP